MSLFDFQDRPVVASGIGLSVMAAATAALGVLLDNWLVAIISVLSVVLIVLVVVIVRSIYKRESEDRLERGLERPGGADAGPRRGDAIEELKTRFRDAQNEIRRTLGGRAGVYELPWYLVFGPDGSGKSSMLQESGLDLPAQYANARIYGPTQSADFWLFNEAIVLDTAGRYFSSESDFDQEEWQELLGLLRSSRPDCPANGLIFTISVEQLLAMSPAQLEDSGRRLRRTLNEIQLGLGLDAPIYVFITKADQLEGFAELAKALPADRLNEAFGWTNDQRRVADPELRVHEAFDELAERLDRLISEPIVRAPDAATRRRIFQLPQELQQLGYAIATFAGTAFKRDVYNATPFLRGIYLNSGRVEGNAVSPTLQRLGHPWAVAQRGVGAQFGHFLRELFRDIVILDEELAMPDSRIGPAARRAILGAGGVVAFCVIGFWIASFVQNYQLTHSLASKAKLARSADPTIQHLEELRADIEYADGQRGLFVNRLGFGMLGRAADDARGIFLSSFDRSFGQATRDNLARALRERDDSAFRAAVALGTDLEWMSNPEGGSETPDLTAYMPRRIRDAEGFTNSYDAYGRWISNSVRDERIDESRDLLARDSKRLLNLGALETQTRQGTGKFAPVSYTALGFAVEESEGLQDVPGIYTEAGFNGLFGYLLSAVESTGSIPEGEIRSLRRAYVDRYDRAWRRFLMDTPTAEHSTADVRKSPYMGLLDAISQNTDFELPRTEEAPAWIKALAEIKREIPAAADIVGAVKEAVGSEERKDRTPPWKQYMIALESVAIDVEDAVADGEQALLIARDAAQGKPTTFSDALEVVRRIVPRSGDATTRTKLREILEGPILDGFSAVLLSARGELDNRWRDRITSPFGGSLSQNDATALYTPVSGELDAFVAEELRGFYDGGNTPGILGSRAMPLGPGFVGWMEQANALQRSLFAGQGGSTTVAVRLKGIPSKVEGVTDLRVKRRDLKLICPSGEQTFAYREGSGAKTFNWGSSCQQVVLRIILGGSGMSEQEIRKEWNGPMAMPSFLRDARNLGSDVLQWSFDTEGGATVHMKYKILSGQKIRSIAHSSPPRSLGS